MSEAAPKRALSFLQSLQLVDASRQERTEEQDHPDQTPPWVAAGLSWREWARRQHS